MEFVEYTAPTFRDLNMRDLKVDEAYLSLESFYDKKNYLYTLSDECYTCPYTKVKAFEQAKLVKNDVIKLEVAHALNFKVYDKDAGIYAADNITALCEFRRDDLQEFGVYNLTVESNGTCHLIVDQPGVNINLSILSVIVLVTIILILMRISFCVWRSYRRPSVPEMASASGVITVVHSKRLRSLDAFRGFAIVLMIFVNSGGGGYKWIEHAPWNGLHLADLVFPCFLWIMGVCIPLSVKSQLARGASKLKICQRILWRAIKLFVIGLCLNSLNGPQLENLRIMGVLQRFGIASFICGTVHTIFSEREFIVSLVPWKRAIHDLQIFRKEFVVLLFLIIVHLAFIFGLNVPDCPKGYLGPGGKHANVAYPNCIGGATGYIDQQILGSSHIYQHPTAKYVYDSKAFDPEGVFGCLLTIVQVQLGILAGVVMLVHNQSWVAVAKRWLCWSIALVLIGGLLCGFSKENGLIPLNKNLWSLSFVFVTSALAFSMLALLYYCIDIRQWWSGSPFVECGMNAIIMYVGHTVMHKMLPWHWKIGAMNTHFLLLLESVWNTSLWIAIALYLNAKKIYYSL